ncbi:MAG: M48 family metallopeptidase [Ignavibacteriaceae bacterium]|nr:M48 family metallopeptidase [Ignavibacteriaceae bacterium]
MKKPVTVSEHIFSGGSKQFAYKLRLSRRAKNIQLQINQEGELQLVLPYRYRTIDHNSFIRSKTDWILKHLRNKQTKDFLYFGNKIIIKPNYDLFEVKTQYHFKNDILSINISSDENPSLKLIYQNWLYERAVEYIPSRAMELAKTYSFNPKRISIRRQKTRWGSCSKSGVISINYKLMMLRKDLIDYVIIHELCHLIELNHSKKFWNLVKDIMPDYIELRKGLKRIRI